MKRILEALKKMNRTILEMDMGILGLGLILQLISLAFPGGRLAHALSLLAGTVLALSAVRHMYRTLERALELDEGGAQKAVYRGYLIRYVTLAAVALFMAATKILNPLLFFLSYMSLKGTVYLQPFTHRMCNKLFHETDPDPEPVEEGTEP